MSAAPGTRNAGLSWGNGSGHDESACIYAPSFSQVTNLRRSGRPTRRRSCAVILLHAAHGQPVLNTARGPDVDRYGRVCLHLTVANSRPPC
jgi:hypothetical protein